MSIAEILHIKFVKYFMAKGNLKKLEKKDEIAIKTLFLVLPTFIGIMIKATLLGFIFNWILKNKGFNTMIISIAILLFIKLDIWFSKLTGVKK